MKRILLICVLVPGIAFGSIGEEINSLLDYFFGGSSEKPTLSEPASSESKLDIPDVRLPENPTSADLENLKKQIMEQENKLQDSEDSISKSQQELIDLQKEKISTESQIFFLDQDIGLEKQRLETISQQEKKWQDELEKLTRQKSDLRAEIRVTQEELNKFLSTNFIRSESLGAEGTMSVLRWIFSDRTVSQILESQQRERAAEAKKKEKLVQLEALKKDLDEQEKVAADLFSKASGLTGQVERQKLLLEQLADAKARVTSRLEFSAGKLEKELEEYRKQQAESTVVLQNLRQELQTAGEKVSTSTSETPAASSAIFAFPLKIPMKIVAGFHDPKYFDEFKQEHNAVDFWAAQGTEIYAPAAGTVKKVALNGYNYSYLILDHGNDLFTVYGHVSDISVSEGQTVAAGGQIALTGGTPGTPGAGFLTTGPHLHFEVFQNGEYKDPMKFLQTTNKIE